MDLGKLVGAAVGGASPIEQGANLVDAANHLLGYFKVSKDVQAQIQAQITAENIDEHKAELAAALAQAQGQIDINKQEAAAGSLTGKFWAGFIAGWRPAIGWICGAGLFWAKIGQPFAVFLLAAFHWMPGPQPLPTLDIAGLLELLIPMLGVATLRTVEKVNNAEGNR